MYANVACHGGDVGRYPHLLRVPAPVWMDSAGMPVVGQLATRVQVSSCLLAVL